MIVLLVGCSSAPPPNVAEAQATPVAEAPPPRTRLGTANVWAVWSRRAPEQTVAFLDDVEALGFPEGSIIRVALGRSGLLGRDRDIQDAKSAAEQAARYGYTSLIHPHAYRDAAEIPIAEVEAGGRRWAAALAADPAFASRVAGFSIQNESGLDYPEVVLAFARGLRAGGYTGTVLPGGVRDPQFRTAAPRLAHFREALATGLLDGVDIHYYVNERDYGRDGALRRAPRAVLDSLLAAAGLPLDTPVWVTETNVQRDRFRSEREAADALRVLLRGLREAGVVGIFPFSPRPPDAKRDRYLIAPGMAVGDALRAFAAEHHAGE